MAIEFTQYVRPNGRKVEVRHVPRKNETQHKANKIIAAGYRFECELLSPANMVAFTVLDPSIDEDIAIQLSPNGPEVYEAVERLVDEVYNKLPPVYR